MEQTLLTRDAAFPQNMDPTGKVWSIFKHDTHPSLFVVNCSTLDDGGKVIPRTNVNVPLECKGEWTHPQRAQAVIEQYLNRMWRMSDEKSKRAPARVRATDAREEETLEALIDEVEKEKVVTISDETNTEILNTT